MFYSTKKLKDVDNKSKSDTTKSESIGVNYGEFIDAPTEIVNDRTMIPVRAVSEAFGCNIGWDDETRSVIVTY